MKTVPVAASQPYEVRVGRGLLGEAGPQLLALNGKPCRLMVMADDRVDGLYGAPVCASLEKSGFAVSRFVFPHGETQKTLATWQGMVNALAEARLTRTDLALALGGGVTGDMAGFAAAAYLRGIRFVQLPTTLLSMVDSSVGGKTGVNLPAGKNLVGAFHQPSLVLCDPDALSTLPRAFVLDGVAEAIKMGVLGDGEMFAWLEAGAYEGHIEEIIRRCVEAKARLVAQDEFDTGSRQLLNLGHTLGHAMERLSDYQMSHGRAVSAGMACAARMAWRMGLCAQECKERILAALSRCGLPVSAPYSAEALAQAALSDKKRAGDSLTLVLPTQIGNCGLHPVPVEELRGLVEMAVAE